MKKICCLVLSVALLLTFTACGVKSNTGVYITDNTERLKTEYPGAHLLLLNENGASLDGTALTKYDYVWHFDKEHEKPYYTGNEPAADGAYISHDIIYYPETAEADFTKENYDGETEWVTRYTADGLTDYIFSTLPVLGDKLPADMMHTAEEAYENPVIHITEAGEYILTGKWKGQILVDLGDGAFTDENAKVTLILNGADVTCTVAPAVIFKNVYECDNAWEDRNEYSGTVDLTGAGARVILADNSENNVTGTNVFRLLKPEYKNEEKKTQKKLCKTDGAFYSYMSLLIDGEVSKTGILNITSADYEGLDSELHLTVNGGYINIVSADDGINVNEDNVSVFTMNGGHLVIFAGQGAEGDVVDSNGYITVNGGFIAGATPSVSDEILDCDREKTVSENATVISNASDIKGGGMPASLPGGKRPGNMPQGEMPDGEPPAGGMTPPDRKPDMNLEKTDGSAARS